MRDHIPHNGSSISPRRGPVLGGPACDKCRACVRSSTLCMTIEKFSLFNGQNFDRSLVFIGDKTVTINANPMPLVQSHYSIECTRHIGCASIVTVLSPIKTKGCINPHVSFSVAVGFVLQPT